MEDNFTFINLEYLNEVSANVEFKKKIFNMFKKEVEDIEKKMITALKSNNTKELADLAHKAKSSVSILGMKAVAGEMKKLELDIINNLEINSYEKRVYDFLDSCKKAIEEINIIEKRL